MGISQRQFEQLTEMGISLWQPRRNNPCTESDQVKQASYLKLETSELNNQVFKDIILSLDISFAEIKTQHDHLDLGLFNWYFADIQASQLTPISCINNKLITPKLSDIANSAKLKRQLWQTIVKNLL